MSKRGYDFESETENFFLELTNQAKRDPLLVFNESGQLIVNRTFRVPNSGAMESMKGDIITAIPWLPRQLKIECKARRTSRINKGAIVNFKKEWITKHIQEAEADHQLPVWTFSFKGMRSGRIWYFMRAEQVSALFGDTEISNMSISVKNQDKSVQFEHRILSLETHDGFRSGKFSVENIGDFWIFSDHMLKLMLKSLKAEVATNGNKGSTI